VFARFRGALDACAWLGLIQVPNRALRESCAAMGRDVRWASTESYAPFAPRWAWLVSRSWEPFLRLCQDRGRLAREVKRAVTGVPEGATGRLREILAAYSSDAGRSRYARYARYARDGSRFLGFSLW